MSYNEVYDYISENMIHEKSKYGAIEAIYARNANELEVIRLYATLANSYEGYTPEFEIHPFNGPDWYFEVYTPDDWEGPGEARLESLSERVERFEAMVKRYDDILNGWERRSWCEH